MRKRAKPDNTVLELNSPGIAAISVSGYKSIKDEQSIEIRPLTILAGANSSGKSSIMQPLLLLKQTLEASYDPGALLLEGPILKFTSTDQLLSSVDRDNPRNDFTVGLAGSSKSGVKIRFTKQLKRKGFAVSQMSAEEGGESYELRPNMTSDEVAANLPPRFTAIFESIRKVAAGKAEWMVSRNRCFLEPALRVDGGHIVNLTSLFRGTPLEASIRGVIPLPGLRGNPARNYPVTAISPTFPGTFESYVASIITEWESEKNTEKLGSLGRDLEQLGLTWKVGALPISDSQVELRVGRLLHRGKSVRDTVSIADVGLGVSQTLPVLVALLIASPGQLVYLEQPEIHLHPRAQVALADVFADAAKRGVRVVVETHSSLILTGVQARVAQGKLSSKLVKLHWFERGPEGSTNVKSADLDDAGAFGEWPEDFGEVQSEADRRYLDAAEAKHLRAARAERRR